MNDRSDEALDRALAANAEEGEPLVEIWCAACGDGVDHLGVVRTSTSGPVLDLVAEVSMDPAVEAQRLALSREWHGRRVPYPVQGATVAILTDPDLAGTDWWPPRAWCPMHGESVLNPNDLLMAARSARPGKPVKFTVPHPDSTAL